MVKKLAKLMMLITLISILTVVGLTSNIISALSITSVNLEQGSVAGGQEVRIYGDFSELLGVKQVSNGEVHSCALDMFGKVYCWGFNNAGQLGHNSPSSSRTAVAVTGSIDGKEITQITSGAYHTCALDTEGLVYCWGDNSFGQIGDGTNSNKLSPWEVNLAAAWGLGNHIVQVEAGSAHTCALDSGGLVYCWGMNYFGQIGDNTSGTSRLVPVAVNTTSTGVMNGKEIVQIVAGGIHTCALSSEDRVYCWGSNHSGQIGDNTSGTDRLTPVAVNTSITGVMNGEEIIQITANNSHTCALSLESKIYCWGGNGFGELGDGTTNTRQTPVAVNTSITGVMDGVEITQITAGMGWTCAIDSAGKVYCWGYNSVGQLGDGTLTNRLVPTAINTTITGVMDGVGITQITAWYEHTCAVGLNGKAYCWGNNNIGQLGNDSTAGSSTPICVHTILDGTGSALPGLGCGRELTITMDINGEPSPCTNIVIANDGQSLTCTTTAHSAGIVDVTINDGVNTVTLANGYEYIDNNNKEDNKPPAINITPPNTGLTSIQTVGLSILSLIIVSTITIGVYLRAQRLVKSR